MSDENAQVQQRQYVIYYRRGGNPWGQLEPVVHEGLYKRPQVAFAVAVMQANPFVEGVCVRLGDDLFNIMALIAGNTDAKAFVFDAPAVASGLQLPGGN